MQANSVTGELPIAPASATSDTNGVNPEFAALALQKAIDAAAELRELRAGTKPRAGYTTNKGRGVSKVKRKMATASRGHNRRK